MPLTIPQIVATYIKAWNETDADKWSALIDKVRAQNGVYQDPSIEVKGRGGLAELIGGFQASRPNVSQRLTDTPGAHHNHVCFRRNNQASGPSRKPCQQ